MKKPTIITPKLIHTIYKPIDQSAHKGSQGHVIIIGGSYGKMGAVCLSSKAALKAGCGLVTAFIPKCGYDIIQTYIPEVMAITDQKLNHISKIEFPFVPNAIGIGPGMGQERETKKAFHNFLRTNACPLVIDADGLNILASDKAWFSLLKKDTVLTPHPKELERIIGAWDSEEEKFEKTMLFSKQHGLIIVMKGAPAYIIDGENCYKNTTGNAALATAGSGDVLTGIISSLLAQSYSALNASLLAVYLHGLTADIALPDTGYQSFIASDIINYIGKAYLKLEKM